MRTALVLLMLISVVAGAETRDGDALFVDSLLSLDLSSPVKDTVVQSIVVLGERGVPRLTDLLAVGDVMVRITVMEAFPKLGAAAVPHVRARYESTTDPLMRRRCLWVLVECGDESLVPLFLRAVEDSQSAVRVAAIDGLARHAKREHLGVFAAALYDPDYDVRRAAVASLADSGWSEAAPLAISALSDGHRGVREQALRSLAAIGKVASRNLAASYEVASHPAKELILLALGRIGRPDKHAQRAFEDAVRSLDETVRAYAARALGETGLRRDLLDKLVDDESPLVRREAAAALAGGTTPAGR